MANTDYYKALELKEDATAEDIKKAFRSLAKKYHPDRHKGDKNAESRFKEISEAYGTLSDPQKKAEYDMMRQYGAYGTPGGGYAGQNPFAGGFRRANPGGARFEYGSSGQQDFGDISDLLSQLFGAKFGQKQSSPFGRTKQRQARGSDIHSQITISFMEAITGATRMLALSDGKKLRVKIPLGIMDAGKIKLAGQGQPGIFGGQPGDLIITVKVMTDQNFERKGNDIYTSVTIPFQDAILGGKVNVKTLSKTISLTIPAGTQPGALLRLKGQGLAIGDSHGDLFVDIKVEIPKELTPEQKKLLEKWGE